MASEMGNQHPGASRLTSRLVLAAVVFSMVIFVVWSTRAEIDQITRVQGTVVPSSRNQVIQALEQGIIEEIPVREGDFVRRGQVLVRFDRARSEAAWLETRAKVVALQAAVARLTAELLGTEPQFPPEVAAYPDILENHRILFQRRQEGLRDELRVLEQTLVLIERELELTLPLQETGDVSQVEILRLQRQQVDTKGKIVNRRNKYLEDAQAELARARENLESMGQLLAQHRQLMEYTEITAPMDGVIRDIRITTRGGFVRAGEEVMQIVPVDDDFIIEARVRPMDIAYVRLGLPATIKFDAYDFMIYGSFPGEVIYISVDTLDEETRSAQDEPFYRVHARLEGKDLVGLGPEPVRIQPGMTATVEIKTGSNTVFNYITKPITRTLHESLGER